MEILIQNNTPKKIEKSKLTSIVDKVIKAELGDRDIGTLNILLDRKSVV